MGLKVDVNLASIARVKRLAGESNAATVKSTGRRVIKGVELSPAT